MNSIFEDDASTVVGARRINYNDKNTGDPREAMTLSLVTPWSTKEGAGAEVETQFMTRDQYMETFGSLDPKSAVGCKVLPLRSTKGMLYKLKIVTTPDASKSK